MAVFFYYKKKEDRDPNELNKVTGCYAKMYGIIIRVFPLLMKALHYGVLVLILVQVFMVFIGAKCEEPYTLDATTKAKTPSPIVQYALWSLVIYAWFWVALV